MVSENIVNDEAKFKKYMNNIENLVNKIFKANSKTKVGIIGITGPVRDTYKDEDGKLITGEKDESTVPGKESNAEIVVEPTNNTNELIEKVKNMNTSKTAYRCNVQAAVRLANKSYSDNVNKILISLYDSAPSVAIGVCGQVSYGGIFSEYATLEEAIKGQHENIATYTKNEILTLKDSNTSFILLRPDDTIYDETWYNVSTGEKVLDFDGSPYVQKLYGTIENPNYGKMYSFNDDNIDNIITENIYKDIEEIIQHDITNVKVTEELSDDIVKNFTFDRKNSSIDVDATKKETVIWNIETITGNEEIIIRYKMKISNIENNEILNKTIAISDKTILTYTDNTSKEYKIEITDNPKFN